MSPIIDSLGLVKGYGFNRLVEPGVRALFAGSTSVIDYVEIPSGGTATSFGTLSIARNPTGNISSSTRAVFGGGEGDAGSCGKTEYVTMATTGNAINFGDGAQQIEAAGCSNSTRGLLSGGRSCSPYIDPWSRIHYITIATTGNVTTFGDSTSGRRMGSGLASPTRGVFLGGYFGVQDRIDYVTIASTGNATIFGSLTGVRWAGIGTACSAVRGVAAGGYDNSNNILSIEYITIATTGNGTNFGNLTLARRWIAGTSNSIVGIFGGGYTTTTVSTIDSVTIASTGNATNFGNLSTSRSGAGAASEAHGGIAA